MRSFMLLATVGGLVFAGCSTVPKQETKVIKPSETKPEIVENLENLPETERKLREAEIQTTLIRDKYEQIEYGQALEMICTDPVEATGKLENRPNLQVMWENYLYDRPEGIWGEIGGLVEVNGNLPLDQGRWTNACTVRLSHMLNKAGHKIPRNGNTTVSGANKDQYIYRLRDLETYLIKAFGKPDMSILDGSADSFDLPTRPGIVLMDFPGSTFFGHVTIWNGASSVDNADIGGHRLLFWDLPCFMPEGRSAGQDAKLDPAP